MLKLFSKKYLTALIVFLSVNTLGSSVTAQECCFTPQCGRVYLGLFGGETWSNSTRLRQTGVAFFSEVTSIGPLSVDARGHSKGRSSGFGGVQLGYEWAPCPLRCGCSNWSLTPAAEVEAFYFSHRKRGHLMSPSVVLPEHDFVASFPMHTGVYLVNGVIALNSCCLGNFSPYIGGGIGAAHISVRGAKSFQIAPVELGVNHFDGKTSDSTWSFAAQAKIGLRYNVCNWFRIFAEYRFMYLDSSRYNFGPTVAPGHVPTTTWDVDVNKLYYNAFAVGIQFDLY